MNSASDIQSLYGIGAKRATLYRKLGINTIGDLLYFYPRNYIDITDIPTKSLSDTITLTANDESGTYSVDTYAYNKQGTASGDAARYLVAYSAALADAFPG